MAAVTTLQLVFTNTEGRTASLSIPDPKPGLTAVEVQTAMQAIIDKNIFTSTGGAFTGISAARVVSRDVTPLF